MSNPGLSTAAAIAGLCTTALTLGGIAVGIKARHRIFAAYARVAEAHPERGDEDLVRQVRSEPANAATIPLMDTAVRTTVGQEGIERINTVAAGGRIVPSHGSSTTDSGGGSPVESRTSRQRANTATVPGTATVPEELEAPAIAAATPSSDSWSSELRKRIRVAPVNTQGGTHGLGGEAGHYNFPKAGLRHTLDIVEHPFEAWEVHKGKKEGEHKP